MRVCSSEEIGNKSLCGVKVMRVCESEGISHASLWELQQSNADVGIYVFGNIYIYFWHSFTSLSKKKRSRKKFKCSLNL